MAKYLKNIKSYSDLKKKYRELIKNYHPDNGGDIEIVQEINCEYDALFKIWKDKAVEENSLEEDEKEETAYSTKMHFYTQYGWEGSRYDSSLGIKDIAKIVRNYVKEKYPTTKWSIRTGGSCYTSSLSVELLEFPERMFMTVDELKEIYNEKHSYINDKGETVYYDFISDTIQELLRLYRRNNIFTKDSWTEDEFFQCYHKTVFEEGRTFFGQRTEYFDSVIRDVKEFILSYNYDDSDSMIDYFSCNFYLHFKYNDCKYVPKTARIKQVKNEVKTQDNSNNAVMIEDNNKCFEIIESEHTETHEKLFLVKPLKKLSSDDFKKLTLYIKEKGGYYSRFTHSFIFKVEPSEFIKGIRF